MPADYTAIEHFFDEAHRVADGWRFALQGNLTSYVYVRPDESAFEVWLGGDSDVTVRLRRPFVYGDADGDRYDPATPDKARLAPLLGIATEVVDDFVVHDEGGLPVRFETACLILL